MLNDVDGMFKSDFYCAPPNALGLVALVCFLAQDVKIGTQFYKAFFCLWPLGINGIFGVWCVCQLSTICRYLCVVGQYG